MSEVADDVIKCVSNMRYRLGDLLYEAERALLTSRIEQARKGFDDAAKLVSVMTLLIEAITDESDSSESLQLAFTALEMLEVG